MHKEGKRKSNDIKYAQVNEAKFMIYCCSSKLNGTFFFSDQLIKYNYGNVDQTRVFVKNALSLLSFKGKGNPEDIYH